MKVNSEAKLLRIFIGEADKVNHKPLYEEIVIQAKSMKMAGATVLRGILGFGPTSHVRSAKILDLSTDLPVVIEVVDTEEKIESFTAMLNELFEKAGCGGLVTMEKGTIIKYLHGSNA